MVPLWRIHASVLSYYRLDELKMPVMLLLGLLLGVIGVVWDQMVYQAVNGACYFVGGHSCIIAVGRVSTWAPCRVFPEPKYWRTETCAARCNYYRPVGKWTFMRRDVGTRLAGEGGMYGVCGGGLKYLGARATLAPPTCTQDLRRQRPPCAARFSAEFRLHSAG